jgi:hypothetical protein
LVILIGSFTEAQAQYLLLSIGSLVLVELVSVCGVGPILRY